MNRSFSVFLVSMLVRGYFLGQLRDPSPFCLPLSLIKQIYFELYIAGTGLFCYVKVEDFGCNLIPYHYTKSVSVSDKVSSFTKVNT